jgi:glycosyltransferase involved in cell wall biosynthesis
MTTPSTPRVTVLLPVWNGEPHLGPAIASVVAQTMPDFELLIVDDGSTDRSREVARSYRDPRVRVLENGRNLGLAATLNRGLREARGSLIARQDADDLSAPDRLALQCEAMDRRRDLALLGTQAQVIDVGGRRAGSIARGGETGSIRWELLFDNAFVHSSVLFRRLVVLDEMGGYDERIRYCQDYELWSRLVRTHAAANLDRALVQCRAHGASMTTTGGEANVRESEAVMVANLHATLGVEVTPADVAVVPKLRLGLPGVDPEQFLSRFESLLAAYRRRFPEVNRSRDFDRTVARQLATVLRVSRFRGSIARRVLGMDAAKPQVLREVTRALLSWARRRITFAP